MCKMCDEGRPHDHSGSLGQFTARFPEGLGRDRGCRGGAESVQRAPCCSATTTMSARGTAAGQGGAMSFGAATSCRWTRRWAISSRPTCWSRARRSSPSDRTCGSRRRVIDARGRIVMPGFVDTHHHQFETALRSFLADGLLFNDGKPHGAINYFEFILGKFAPVYRPQDVYINELFGALSQIDCGRHDGARHLADPSLAASTPTPRSRAWPTRGAAASSATSRARALFPATSIRRTRAASRSSTSPPTTSS